MEARITSRTVSALKPKEKPYQVHDETIHGFLLRVQPSGVMTYYYEYRLPSGYKNRLRIEKHGKISPEQARDRAKKIAADLVNGIDPKASKKQSKIPTLEVMVDEIYAPWAEAHIKSGKSAVKRIKARFAHLLSKSIDDPQLPWSLEKWKSARLKEGISKLTINRDLTRLKSAFSYAAKNSNQSGITQNPLSSVKLFKVSDEESERIRYLNQHDPEEESRLFAAIFAREEEIKSGRDRGNAWREERDYPLLPSFHDTEFVTCLRPMLELAMNTGLRRGELFNARWSNVNWNLSTPVLTVRGSFSKNSKSRTVPLNENAARVLKNWWKEGTDPNSLIFPGKEGKPFSSLKTAWNRILEKAKIEDFRWHDLRHTFASRLVMAGVDLNTVRDLLGHKDIKMTLRYAHLSPEVKAEAVAKLVSLPSFINKKEKNG